MVTMKIMTLHAHRIVSKNSMGVNDGGDGGRAYKLSVNSIPKRYTSRLALGESSLSGHLHSLA